MSHHITDEFLKSIEINILEIELVNGIIKLAALISIIILNFFLLYNIILMGLVLNIYNNSIFENYHFILNIKGISILNDLNKIDFNDTSSKFFCNKTCYLFSIWLFILSMCFPSGFLILHIFLHNNFY